MLFWQAEQDRGSCPSQLQKLLLKTEKRKSEDFDEIEGHYLSQFQKNKYLNYISSCC
jgi:hypothetical protein